MQPYFDRGYRNKGFDIIIGVDEAGRGPLAGPVVAAAVLLKYKARFKNKIDDSKKLTAQQREAAFLELMYKSYFDIGIIDEKAIDSSNILIATRLAMEKAVACLLAGLVRRGICRQSRKTCILVDGGVKLDIPGFSVFTVVKGDAKSRSIGAASIVAKVKRDRIMASYDKVWPQYGFSRHKGYPTLMHRRRLAEFGPCPIHRLTFAYV
jgi:ribonuclease HII